MLLKRYKEQPAIICIQRNVDKIVPTIQDTLRSNELGMGNKVGTITNRVTAMFDKQQDFDVGSPEWKEIEKRIESGQLYQQNEID